MFHTLKTLQGFTIRATDGDIGTVDDFYFNDDEWAVRYLVVDTGDWLDGRKVLLSPNVLGQPDDDLRIFPVSLSRQQVQDSPNISSDKPVSRQDETLLASYYGWPAYWAPGMDPLMAMGQPVILPDAVPVTGNLRDNRINEEGVDDAPPSDQRVDQHLRSFREVEGYRINAGDGQIGKVDDFITEEEKWNILYLVVDAGNLFTDRKVLVSPTWVTKVSWEDQVFDVDLQVETIKNSPEFDPSRPLDRDFEENLHRHYGRKGYWD